MNFPLFIAKRYLFSNSSKNAINIIARIAVIGAAIGSLALFVVLSGFSGLKDFSLQFTNVFDADLEVFPANGKTLVFSEDAESHLNTLEGVDHYAQVVQERVFLRYRGKNHIAFIKGVDDNYGKVNPIDSILFLSEWFVPGQNEAVIGLGTASTLSLGVRDYNDLLDLYVPKPGTGQILDPTRAFSKESVVVSGVYQVNEELDSKFVFTDIDLARNLLRLDSTQISSLVLKLDNGVDEDMLRTQLAGVFTEEIEIKNRIQQNDALYKMLNTENLFVYFFVSLIAAIAIFNIAGTIIMVILEKRGNIKTLFSMGLTISEIRKIFFYNGFLMTLLGVTIGLVLGITAVLLQLKYGFVPITPSLPYPVKFDVFNVVIVFVTISLLGALASKIASTRVTPRLLS